MKNEVGRGKIKALLYFYTYRQSNLLVTSIYFFFTAGDIIQWREAFSHWVPEDWPQYIAWTPALVLVIWQVCQFVKIHKKYCLRFGLVDNALLGMAKPRMQSWTISRYRHFFYKTFLYTNRTYLNLT